MEPTRYTPDPETQSRIANNHRYHAPKPGSDQPERYEEVRYLTGDLAHQLTRLCPPSRELSVALTKLEEAMFWANTAIARNERTNE